MDKKAQAGLGLPGRIMMTLLILAVLATTINIALSSIRQGGESALPGETEIQDAELLSAVSEVSVNTKFFAKRECTLSGVICTNESADRGLIPASNITVSGCSIAWAGGNSTANINNSNWLCNSTASFKDAEINDISTNVTTGVSGFFREVGTWMTILGVVVLLLIISVIILVVQKFGGGPSAGGSVGTSISGGRVERGEEGLI